MSILNGTCSRAALARATIKFNFCLVSSLSLSLYNRSHGIKSKFPVAYQTISILFLFEINLLIYMSVIHIFLPYIKMGSLIQCDFVILFYSYPYSCSLTKSFILVFTN